MSEKKSGLRKRVSETKEIKVKDLNEEIELIKKIQYTLNKDPLEGVYDQIVSKVSEYKEFKTDFDKTYKTNGLLVEDSIKVVYDAFKAEYMKDMLKDNPFLTKMFNNNEKADELTNDDVVKFWNISDEVEDCNLLRNKMKELKEFIASIASNGRLSILLGGFGTESFILTYTFDMLKEMNRVEIKNEKLGLLLMLLVELIHMFSSKDGGLGKNIRTAKSELIRLVHYFSKYESKEISINDIKREINKIDRNFFYNM